MTRKRGSFERQGLFIDYGELGTINIDEFIQAVLTDIHVLKDTYHVQYIKNARLRLLVTNEYGEELKVRRPTGGTIYYMDTHHYRPACKDYEL
jgi:hypothetical protein